MLKECNAGHVFDADFYEECPYCGIKPVEINFGDHNGTGYGGSLAAFEMKTIGLGRLSRKEDPADLKNSVGDFGKTVGIFESKKNFDPIVGWLVCVSGPVKGKVYDLYARINFIGRDRSNDVYIPEDLTISQKGHVRVAYDSAKNAYWLIPGMGRNIVTYNDGPLLETVRLNPYDTVEFGSVKLMFVPLCGDKFQW